MAEQADNKSPFTQPFNIKDCALVAMATGYKAQNLREFKEGLLRVHESSIYHHFWGRFLEPQFDEPEYSNDFASWVYRRLNEKALAEKLSVIDPTDYEDIDAIRHDLVECIEDVLYENEFVPWTRADEQFHFVRSQIVVLDTGRYMEIPSDLSFAVPEMTIGSIFYHFIDARRRTEDGSDDFSAWLTGWGDVYNDLRLKLMAVDPFFSSLKELRFQVTHVLEEYFGGGNS
jgi:hypothetical protein|nr:hypothetical protein [Deltaproteobacteria bacterium]